MELKDDRLIGRYLGVLPAFMDKPDGI